MAAEGAGGCELTQLVTDHFFGYIYGNVLPAIMDGDSVTYEVREDGRCAGPCLNDGFLAAFVHSLYTVEQTLFNVRAFLY